jgi:predicted MFS family arabinose efflux permease
MHPGSFAAATAHHRGNVFTFRASRAPAFLHVPLQTSSALFLCQVLRQITIRHAQRRRRPFDARQASVALRGGSTQTFNLKVPGGLHTARALYFLGYATVGAVAPYLSTYITTATGLPLGALGALGALTPIATTVSSPLWGAVADKTRRHEEILLGNHILSVALRSMLLLLVTSAAVRAHSRLLIPLIVGSAAFMMAPVYSIFDDLAFR